MLGISRAPLPWLDAEYTEFISPGFAGDPGDPGLEPGEVDLDGNSVPRVADWKFTLNTGYEIAAGKYGTVTPSLSLVVSDDFYNTQFNTEIGEQDGYAKLDLRLLFQSPDKRFSVEGFVENVTDEDINSYGVFGGANAYFANFDPPRTVGLRVGYRQQP